MDKHKKNREVYWKLSGAISIIHVAEIVYKLFLKQINKIIYYEKLFIFKTSYTYQIFKKYSMKFTTSLQIILNLLQNKTKNKLLSL
jgi:hypothetical protein